MEQSLSGSTSTSRISSRSRANHSVQHRSAKLAGCSVSAHNSPANSMREFASRGLVSASFFLVWINIRQVASIKMILAIRCIALALFRHFCRTSADSGRFLLHSASLLQIFLKIINVSISSKSSWAMQMLKYYTKIVIKPLKYSFYLQWLTPETLTGVFLDPAHFPVDALLLLKVRYNAFLVFSGTHNATKTKRTVAQCSVCKKKLSSPSGLKRRTEKLPSNTKVVRQRSEARCVVKNQRERKRNNKRLGGRCLASE